jgi:hypothetical protein
MNLFLQGRRETGGVLVIFLILICFVGIVAIIEVPKRLHAENVAAEYLCHENMLAFMDAEISYQSMNRTYTDSIPELAEIRGIAEEKWVCPVTGERYIINLIEIGGRVRAYEIKCNGGGHGEIVRDKPSWE